MKKAIKIILLILLFLAVAVGAVFGYRWLSGRTAEAPLATEGQTYLTTSASTSSDADEASEEKDDLESDSSIESTTEWPFADSKSESKFEAKESVGYTAKSTSKTTTKTSKSSDNSSDEEETTKKSSSTSAGSAKAFLQDLLSSASKTSNGHPVVVDSDGISIEYKKFAVADLNGDGEKELFLYAESTKGDDFYGYSYIVYDSNMKSSRTTTVVDEFDSVTFYASGAYEIVTNKYGFVSDSVATSFGVKNENSILGFDTTATPYLQYNTNGPYIDNPSEISASDYKSKVSKLQKGGKVDVTVYDFTSSNVSKL